MLVLTVLDDWSILEKINTTRSIDHAQLEFLRYLKHIQGKNVKIQQLMWQCHWKYVFVADV
jgi:hypothetical protein